MTLGTRWLERPVHMYLVVYVRICVTVWCCASAAMAQRKSELLRLQTLERIAGFQQDLEGQLQIMLSNPELTVVK